MLLVDNIKHDFRTESITGPLNSCDSKMHPCAFPNFPLLTNCASTCLPLHDQTKLT